jgi:hypothetical protein
MNILSIETYLNSVSKSLDVQTLPKSVLDCKVLKLTYTIFIYLISYYYYLRVTLHIEFKHNHTSHNQSNNEL